MLMDFIQALERPVIIVILNGVGYQVRKSSLYQFFRQQEILREKTEDRIIKYVAFSIFDSAVNEQLEVAQSWFYVDVVDAFEAIFRLNTPMMLHIDTMKDTSNISYNYTNKALAAIVTRLASAFHWDRDFILHEITYDEAKCYLQQLVEADHQDREFAYSLSEVGFDKRGKKQKFPPLPFDRRLPDEVEAQSTYGQPVKIIKINSKYLPVGEIYSG